MASHQSSQHQRRAHVKIIGNWGTATRSAPAVWLEEGVEDRRAAIPVFVSDPLWGRWGPCLHHGDSCSSLESQPSICIGGGSSCSAGLLEMNSSAFVMSGKVLISFWFWKLFSLGMEPRLTVFLFSTLKMLLHILWLASIPRRNLLTYSSVCNGLFPSGSF